MTLPAISPPLHPITITHLAIYFSNGYYFDVKMETEGNTITLFTLSCQATITI
jgi:hypothetical protein